MRKYGTLKIQTAPAAEPVSLSDAKLFLKVDSSTDDDLITSLISVARVQVENYLNRKLITQTWDYFLDSFPCDNSNQWWDGVKDGALNQLHGSKNDIDIPLSPVSSITHLKTYDETDTAYTMSSSDYYADIKANQFSRLSLRTGSSWPSTALRVANGIEIRAVVGYGASGSNVPAPIIQAIKNTLLSLYDCRGEGGGLSVGSMAMLEPYRIMPR